MTQANPVERNPGQGNWMITFADLLSLLLTFFVLLFSMSTIENENWKAVVVTMSDQFSSERPQLAVVENDTLNQLTLKTGPGLNLNYLRVLLQRTIDGHASFEGATVERESGRVIISLPAALFFNPKDTSLIVGAMKPLERLAGSLAQIKNKIRVSGHTNAAPVASGKFRSNWELSMARARIVAGILTDSGYRRPMTVLGYADTVEAASDAVGAERVEIEIVAERGQKGLYDIF